MWAWKCIIWDYRLPGSTLRPRLTRGLFWCLFTGTLWGELTTHRWILITKGHQCGAFWISSLSSCTRTVEYSVELPSMVDPIWMRPGCGLAVFSTQSALLRLTVAIQTYGANPVYIGFNSYVVLLLSGFLLLQWRPSINIRFFFIDIQNIIWRIQIQLADIHVGLTLEWGLSTKLLAFGISSVIPLIL